MNRSIRATLAAALALTAVAADAPVAPQLAVQKSIHIGGAGRWDYASVDPVGHRLYMTRSTHTQAVDLDTGKVVLDVPGQKRSHGVVAVPAVGRGYLTDGGSGTIVIFDLKTGEVLGNVAAADDADGEIYDAGTNKVLVTCGDGGVMAVLDAAADPKTAKADTVDLGGKPEFLAADGKGMAYANLEDKSQVAVVDLKAMKVTAHWSLGGGESPAGLAIDAVHGRLFVGCHNKKLIVLDTKDGKVLAELPIGTGNDACGFDPGTGEAFASEGDGTLTVAKETSPGTFEVVQTVTTPRGARTLAVDPSTHLVYLPTAEFNPPAPGERRPTMKPGTFMVAVVGPAAK
jgi:DNA-binding beta-propeller fold protein YncE